MNSAISENRDWVVETHDLTKRYGPRIVAVDRLNLRVRRGEIYGFIGPNGAGKTTTLRMLLGLIRPTSGAVSIFAAPPGSSRSLRRLGALIETPTFYPFLSARDNLRVSARYAGISNSQVETALVQVKLLDRAGDAFQTYSLGMKQRLGVAAALLKDPDFLILDEPTNGLDPPGMADMRALIQELGRIGRTVLFSSHQLQDVERLCDRVGMIYRGRLIAEGTVAELCPSLGMFIRADPLADAHRCIATLIGSDRVRDADGGLIVDIEDDQVSMLTRRLVEVGAAVHEVRALEQSLEERFFAITRTMAIAAADEQRA